MNKILILFGHPAFKRSTINAALRKAVENLEGITFHDLYASYPDFLIDVTLEQKLCERHDIIVFQHPFYWYSTPAIIKEWFDLLESAGAAEAELIIISLGDHEKSMDLVQLIQKHYPQLKIAVTAVDRQAAFEFILL